MTFGLLKIFRYLKFFYCFRYTEDLIEFFTNNCFYVVATSVFSVTFTLTGIVIGGWMSDYAYLLSIICQIFVFCLVGTVLQHQVSSTIINDFRFARIEFFR